MKPFAVRLAAGAGTILLGALAAAQAQKDQQTQADSSWSLSAPPTLGQPPAPIQPDSADDSEDETLSGPTDYGVQLVQHTEPHFEVPQHASPQQASIALPDSDLGVTIEDIATDEAAADNLPIAAPPANAITPANLAAGPAMNFAMYDTSTGQPIASPPAAAPPTVAMPLQAPPAEFGYPTQPTNELRGGDDYAAPDDFSAPNQALDRPALDSSTLSGPQPLLRAVQWPQPDGVAALPNEPAQPTPAEPPVVGGQPLLTFAASPDSYLQPADETPYENEVGGANVTTPLMPAYESSPSQSSTYADPPAAVVRLAPNASIASPGERHLEGIQSPSVVIHKRAPNEVKVGKPAAFVIQVQNVGSAEALDVAVHDRVPAGMRLVDASPAPIQQGDLLMWQLGTLAVGDERTVTMQLIPEQEGELGSVARVTFEAAASVRTISTRPELKIVQTAPPQVLIGQQLEIELEVSNPGTGAATGVVLQEDVPEALEHPKGRQLDNLIGTLGPGETRRQVLRLRAVAAGVVRNQIRLSGDDGLEAMDTIEVEVISPQLQVNLSGPQKRFLERQATYQLEIANVGTADASNVEIAAQLDRGFTFVSTDFEGQYDPSRHTVYWSLASLPRGGSGLVPLTVLPIEEGEQAIRLEARGDLGVMAKQERTVSVSSLAELSFAINDDSDPIEVGGETVYEIRVSNRGSRHDTNVRVHLQLPPGLKLIGADGDAQEDGRGGILFEPRQQLAANAEMLYRVRAEGVAAGTHLVKAIVTSDQSKTPVTKEESTLVYADQ